MWLYACCGLLCSAYPQHFAHGSVNKIPGYPGRAGTLTGLHPMQVCRCRRPPHPVTFRRSSSTRCGFGIYTKPFPLVDITVVDDNEIMNHRRMAALTLLMKHIRHRDMMELLDKLPQVMVEISDEQVRVLIHYIVNAGDSVSPEFMRALAERLPQHEDKLMTIAERLEQKGRQEGRMEGRMEGALEKALAIACQLQKMGMTPEQIKQATGLSDDELKKITH